MSCINKMERYSNPKSYEVALKQSLQSGKYALDTSKYGYCRKVDDVVTNETDYVPPPLDTVKADSILKKH